MEKNAHKPLISVILPVYNVERYLPQCVESLFSQTYTNIELIIVDDGSKEECSALCDTYIKMDKRVRVFHKENGGLSDARNYGLSKAAGDYVSFVDSDDYVDSDYVEYLYSLIERFNTKMSLCQHRVVYEKHIKDYGNDKKEEVLPAKSCIEKMLYHETIDTSAWAKLYHRSLFEEVSYPVDRLFEDIATTYKLMLNSKSVAIGYKSKYNYCYRKNSIVNKSFSSNKLDLLDMTDDMAIDVEKLYPDLHDAILRRRVYARFSTLNQMLYISGVKEQRNKIISFIKSNSKAVFLDARTPKRDKIAIILLYVGYPVYELAWTIFKRVSTK